VVLGEDLEGDNNAVLANAGGAVTGVGQLVMDAGGLLSVDASGDGNSFDLAGLLGNNELPLLGDQLGDTTGIVATVTDTVNGLVGGNDVLGGVTDTVDGLVGGNDVLGGVTDTVDGLVGGNDVLGGVTDTVDGLVGGDDLLGGVTDTVDGLTGGDELLGGVTDVVDGLTGGDELLGGVTDTVNEVAGGLLGDDGGDGDGGIIDAVDDALLDPILGGIL
jgi:hypothetical protein